MWQERKRPRRFSYLPANRSRNVGDLNSAGRLASGRPAGPFVYRECLVQSVRLGREQLGAIKLVDRVAAGCGQHQPIDQQRCRVSGPRIFHGAGAGPSSGRRVI